MNREEIESSPAMRNLLTSVNLSPTPEYKKELYKTAQAFLSEGAKNGIIEGGGLKSKQDDWMKYLAEKINEIKI